MVLLLLVVEYIFSAQLADLLAEGEAALRQRRINLLRSFMYFVYVLRSKKDGRCYTGITDNLSLRIKQHNRGSKATPSTQNRGPFDLIYYEKMENRLAARKQEKFLKSGVGREFIKSVTI